MPSKKSPARTARAKSPAKTKLSIKTKPAPAAPAVRAAAGKPAKRENTKLGSVIALLRKPEGTTIAAMMKATGWQDHSVRGAIAGAIKKKLGLAVTSEVTGDERRYRIAAEG